MRNTAITGVCVALSLVATSAWAQIAVSSNDHKVKQENGVTSNVDNPTPDSITILDLGQSPVKVLGTVNNVPGSVVGPPTSVAITPDESVALVAASTQIDPADKTKTKPDTKVSVVDLKGQKVLDTINTGAGAAGISMTKDGRRAYVANRMCATWVFESLVQGPILCGLLRAYCFTAPAARRSELPSRSTGLTALPSTLA